MQLQSLDPWHERLKKQLAQPNIWQQFHIDVPLMTGMMLLSCMGLLVLFSAADQNQHVVYAQAMRMLLAFSIMLVCAQFPPQFYRRIAVAAFAISCALLILVLVIGHISKGAQRWFNLGIVKFQPSELLKLTLPLVLAHYLGDQPLPLKTKAVIHTLLLAIIPTALVIKQPDLGSGLVLAAISIVVLLLAGLSWRWVIAGLVCIAAAGPLLWNHLHDYQRQRVLMFLDPESDPLGSGYHIIQSKIAIGSGGLFGKGWLNGTQSHLSFLPEHATDFIFAVCGEELGFFGCSALIAIYLFITLRALQISLSAQDTFSRLLAGSLGFAFLLSVMINMGMVSGLLPVVGLPLPMVSYGGSAQLILCAGFGIVMSIRTHRRLVA